MSPAEREAVRLEIGRSYRARDDALAFRLLARFEERKRSHEFTCPLDDVCSCGAPMELGDWIRCERCQGWFE